MNNISSKKCYYCSKIIGNASFYLNIPLGFWEKNTDPDLCLIPWYQAVHHICYWNLVEKLKVFKTT